MTDLCINGHDDWYVTPAGKRRCRTCRREREAGVRDRKTTTKDTDGSLRIAQRTRREANGCLIWTGQLNDDGYGVLSVGNKYVRAHRQSWENVNGPVPDGLELDHLCRNRACVEPTHLEPVTTRVNSVERGTGPSAQNARKTHCPKGHEYTRENTYVSKRRGERSCRQCALDRSIERRSRK